jgi:hypothetical protein
MSLFSPISEKRIKPTPLLNRIDDEQGRACKVKRCSNKIGFIEHQSNHQEKNLENLPFIAVE